MKGILVALIHLYPIQRNREKDSEFVSLGLLSTLFHALRMCGIRYLCACGLSFSMEFVTGHYDLLVANL